MTPGHEQPAALADQHHGTAQSHHASARGHVRAAFAERTRPEPPAGLLAGVPARPVPAHPGPWKVGIAELLGRRLTVRIPPGAVESRPLAHELLHLFGAVLVSGRIDSLMNPTGAELKLDPLNLEIVRTTRNRGFSTGGPLLMT